MHPTEEMPFECLIEAYGLQNYKEMCIDMTLMENWQKYQGKGGLHLWPRPDGDYISYLCEMFMELMTYW